MGEFFLEYGMFLAKAVTTVIAIAAIAVIIVGASRKAPRKDGLSVEKLNDKYRQLKKAVQQKILGKAALKKEAKAEKKSAKQEKKDKESEDDGRKRIFVIDFKGDIRATAVSHLRREITAIISVAKDRDEVVLRLENPGGAVHEHGLAASQLLRITERGVPLTVVIDKVAASGGYLMACIANRIVAAPFAVIGSIGVIAQIPNFNRALESRGVDFEMITAGKYKRTVTMFGKNTDEDRAKLAEELEEVHTLFKQMVAEHRPSLDVEGVATGEHWYGTRALELGLIDQLGTSDDYLLNASKDSELFHVSYSGKQSLQEKILSSFESSIERLIDRFAGVRHR